MSKQSRTTLLALAPLTVLVGIGISCAPTGSGTAEAGPPSAEIEALRSDLTDTQAELEKTQELLNETTERLDDLSKKFGQHFLITGHYYKVTKVVDGDTFVLDHTFKVRLLGVNTPESVHPSQPVDWYGVESSKHMKDLILGKNVRLEPEEGTKLGKGGAYGRVLAYVFLEDGTDVNAAVVRGGYGQSYHKYPCKRRAQFDKLQALAKAEKAGQWNDEARLKWEETHIIPEIAPADAKIIVSKSGKVHALVPLCGAGPDLKNGKHFFLDVAQAKKFGFDNFHSCLKGK